MMLALEMFRSLPRHAAGRVVGGRMPGVLSGFAAPLRLVTIDEPRVQRPGWARLRTRLSGICGSDLGALSGRTSLYFSAVVSMPFVPGHEVVAELVDDCEDLPAGTRVVVDLVRPSSYESKIDGRNLILTVANGVTGSATATAMVNNDPTKAVAARGVEVSNLDFRRGKNGEGRAQAQERKFPHL